MNKARFQTELKKIPQGVLLLGLAVIVLGLYALTQEKPGAASKAELFSFERDCVTRVLEGVGRVLPSCSSAHAMEKAYNVNPIDRLVVEHGRLIYTAQLIANGEITDEQSYHRCLDADKCVPIPVFRPNTDRSTPEAKATKAEFWHLAHGGGPTAATCKLTDICQALVKIGIIPPPPALPVTP